MFSLYICTSRKLVFFFLIALGAVNVALRGNLLYSSGGAQLWMRHALRVKYSALDYTNQAFLVALPRSLGFIPFAVSLVITTGTVTYLEPVPYFDRW